MSDKNKADPKLQEAMAEIKAIMVKHNIAGRVILSSESHIEFMDHLQLDWTCIVDERDTAGKLIGVRIRSKLEEYPSKEAQKEIMENTIGLLVGTMETTRQRDEAYQYLLERLSKTIGFTSWQKVIENRREI